MCPIRLRLRKFALCSVFEFTNHPFSPKIQRDDHNVCLYYSAFIILLILTRFPTALAEWYPRVWHRKQQKGIIMCLVSSPSVTLVPLWMKNLTFGLHKTFCHWNVAPFHVPQCTQCYFFVFIWKIKWFLSGSMCLQDKDLSSIWHLMLVPDTSNISVCPSRKSWRYNI